jgi:hypothetical protein
MVHKKGHKRRVAGVPIGYPEDWAYHGHWKEKKTGIGKWKFTFKATKTRKAKSYGSFGKGTTGRWQIKGIQYITKTGKGKYQTKLVGTKRSLGFKVKKPKRR